VSNRQLLIVGSFAVVCCAILAVALQRSAPVPPPKLAEPNPSRYSVVAVAQGDEAPHVVVLDTVTGEAWQMRLQTDAKEAGSWRPIGAPGRIALPPANLSAM
jgi:hypothetical protein